MAVKWKTVADVLAAGAILWRDLFEAFPPLDPASEFSGQDVKSCADVVQWISENTDDIRQAIYNAETILRKAS